MNKPLRHTVLISLVILIVCTSDVSARGEVPSTLQIFDSLETDKITTIDPSASKKASSSVGTTNNVRQETLIEPTITSPSQTLPKSVVQQNREKEVEQKLGELKKILTPEELNDITLDFSSEIETIDLLSAVKIALCHNLDIKITDSQRLQEKWQLASSLLDFIPSVSLGYNQSRYEGTVLVGGIIPLDVVTRTVSPYIQLNVQAFSGFRTTFNSIASYYRYKASEENLNSTVDIIVYEVAQSYYSLLQSKANIFIAETAVLEAKNQLYLNQERFKIGVGTKLDVLQSESLLSNAEQRLIQSQNDLKIRMVAFSKIIGVDLFKEFAPIDETLEPIKLVSEDLLLEDLVDIAFLNRSELERDRKSIRALVNQKRSTISNYLPSISISRAIQGSGSELGNVQRNDFTQVSFAWNGLTNMGLSGIVQNRRINSALKEAEYSLEATLRNIQEEVMQSYFNRENAKELLVSSEKELETTKEALRLAALRLSAEVGNNTDYINAQVNFTNAKVQWVNALIEYNLTEVKLLKDMGIINIDRLASGIDKEDLLALECDKK